MRLWILRFFSCLVLLTLFSLNNDKSSLICFEDCVLTLCNMIFFLCLGCKLSKWILAGAAPCYRGWLVGTDFLSPKISSLLFLSGILHKCLFQGELSVVFWSYFSEFCISRVFIFWFCFLETKWIIFWITSFCKRVEAFVLTNLSGTRWHGWGCRSLEKMALIR